MSIDYEKFWSSGNSSNLLSLAKDIESQDAWRGFLTIQEHEVFKYVLENGGDIWTEFINGNVICRLEQETLSDSIASQTTQHLNGSSRSDTSAENGDDLSKLNTNNTESNGEDASNNQNNNDKKNQRLANLDPVTVAFRVRYMLYEKSIQLLFPSHDPDISPDIDYQLLESKDKKLKETNFVSPQIPAKRVIDDDYDDEESDEEKKESEKPKPSNEVLDIQYDPSGKHIITSRYNLAIAFIQIFTNQKN